MYRVRTLAEKRAITERIFAVWSQYPNMLLSTLLRMACGENVIYWDDDEVCRALEEFLRTHPPTRGMSDAAKAADTEQSDREYIAQRQRRK